MLSELCCFLPFPTQNLNTNQNTHNLTKYYIVSGFSGKLEFFWGVVDAHKEERWSVFCLSMLSSLLLPLSPLFLDVPLFFPSVNSEQLSVLFYPEL